MHWRRAFTLIELLVVLGIISLLVAILLPTMSRARQRARIVSCMANVRFLSQTASTYAAEHRGFFTAFFGYGNGGSLRGAAKHWPYLLFDQPTMTTPNWDYSQAPFRRNVTPYEKSRICPETAITEPWSSGLSPFGTAHTTWTDVEMTAGAVRPDLAIPGSYAFNGWLYDTERMDMQRIPMTIYKIKDNLTPYFYRMNAGKNPGMIPVFADSVWDTVLPKPDDPPGKSLESPLVHALGSATSVDLTALYSMQTMCMDRHRLTINVGYLDGHVENTKVQNLWTLPWSPNWSRNTPQTIPTNSKGQ